MRAKAGGNKTLLREGLTQNSMEGRTPQWYGDIRFVSVTSRVIAGKKGKKNRTKKTAQINVFIGKWGPSGGTAKAK